MNHLIQSTCVPLLRWELCSCGALVQWKSLVLCQSCKGLCCPNCGVAYSTQMINQSRRKGARYVHAVKCAEELFHKRKGFASNSDYYMMDCIKKPIGN